MESGIREKIVIATKTQKRDGAGAMLDLENSLRMMKTDYIDLYQLHQIARSRTGKRHRQHSHVIPIPGFDSIAAVDQVVAFYDAPNRVTAAEEAQMDQYRSELGKQFCRRCEYCQPCPNGVMITPAMGYRIVANRMSHSVASKFLREAMESTRNCEDCGTCIERCPYDLPIPDMLRANYALNEQHLKERS